jgi:monoamine oxidase
MADFDCVIVGAGFAGLAAADLLSQSGKRVCVVEARERVGGRVATTLLSDGTPVDIGGQWLGPTHDRMYALCRRFGAEVYPMYTGGKNLLVLGGETRTYRGHVPLRAPLLTLFNLGWVLVRLDRLARSIPLEAPWEGAHAARLDQRTLGDWIRQNVPNSRARSMVEIGVESVFAAHADELSLLHALFYMRSGNSFDFLTQAAGGAQQDRVSGGVQHIAERLAEEIAKSGEVLLEAPVSAIEQTANGVTLETSKGPIHGARAILALPPPLAAEISFAPALSPDKRELLARLPMGAVIKCIAAYPHAFWRERGFSGQSVCDRGPVNVTFDASPKSGTPGVLLGFIEGPAARELARETVEKRRAIAVDAFAQRFGPDAREPIEYVDRAWTEERWSRGCYAALFPPGVWTSVGHSVREPEGRLHFAGTETASRWNGYIEGAVLSGERAAREVLASDV